MAAVLWQADPNCSESVAAEKSEDTGGPCLLDKAKTGPRLIPILFMARLCTARETNATDTSISTLLQHEWPTQALDVFMMNLPVLSPKNQA
jgi:hypothetical protein